VDGVEVVQGEAGVRRDLGVGDVPAGAQGLEDGRVWPESVVPNGVSHTSKIAQN
jgi:hypothetical protein